MTMDDISSLMSKAAQGDTAAQDALFAAAYPELRKLARARLRDGGRHTCLDTTVLVHESYLRCLRGGPIHGEGRKAFFAYASRVMRSVIIDDVRQRQAQRRGGERERLTLDTHLSEQLPATDDRAGEDEVLRVSVALDALADVEPRLAKVVEMRYFGGYTELEIAESLGLTERTVRRDWDKARLLLSALLSA